MKKIIYQIYPPSFQDSNNDGWGDLKGIISRLDYIKQLGANYIWLTPIFLSPLKDNGYDISDYYNIDSRFGTNKDLKDLIVEGEKRGIKIILDMVFNHTSSNHKWFQGWLNNDPQYKDFYIAKFSQGKPPTNWKSKFGGSAWEEYQPNYWYLHLFSKYQPDLNWKNPLVIKEIKKVLKHYTKLGIKGFRFDVINLISKSEYTDDNNGDGRRFYTDGPRVHDFIADIAKSLPQDDDFFTIGELSSTNIRDCINYTSGPKKELDSVFIFHHLKVDYIDNDKFKTSQPNISQLNNIFQKWWTKDIKMGNFLNNHDQPRSISRFISPKYYNQGAKMLFALTCSLPGTPFIYQGEEIGMLNPRFNKISQYRDVETIRYLTMNNFGKIPPGVKDKSRDNSRTPMQWDDSLHSGFSLVTPWIDLSKDYQNINVKKQSGDKNSILNFYKNFIIFIKKDQTFNITKIVFHKFMKNVISFNRGNYKFIFSFNDKTIIYEYNKKEIVYSNYEKIIQNKLQPYQFIIKRIKV